ncbi:MAG: hypothetical protein IPM02_21560 [Betaproteobacteria bacterium]|nr:hypothetical protein [Betaproteobacteria bacterium]
MQFSAANYGVGESGGSATITVTRVGGTDGLASVHYASSNGSATAGADYTAASGTLNWGNGDGAAKTFTVTILNDGAPEGNETINLTLSNPAGASLGNPDTATLTISGQRQSVARSAALLQGSLSHRRGRWFGNDHRVACRRHRRRGDSRLRHRRWNGHGGQRLYGELGHPQLGQWRRGRQDLCGAHHR